MGAMVWGMGLCLMYMHTHLQQAQITSLHTKASYLGQLLPPLGCWGLGWTQVRLQVPRCADSSSLLAALPAKHPLQSPESPALSHSAPWEPRDGWIPTGC